MLPGLGFSEIAVLAIIALLVVGPKDLPLMLRKLGRFTAKLRGMAHEFQTGFDDLARQAELDDLRREVNALRRATSPTAILDSWARPIEADHTPVDIDTPVDDDTLVDVGAPEQSQAHETLADEPASLDLPFDQAPVSPPAP